MSIHIALYKRVQRFTVKTKNITYIYKDKYKQYNIQWHKMRKKQYLGNKCVFNWLLKTVTDGTALMLTESRFQSRGPHTCNELSPAWRFERGMASLVASEEEHSRRRLSSVLLEALYNLRMSVRYLGAWLLRDL